MTAIGLCSAKGSPGVTTTALALAQIWPQAHPGRRVLLVDADPAGGDIAAGYLRGEVDTGRGVVGLAAGRGPDPLAALSGQLLGLDETGERLLLLGVPDSRRAAAVAGAWPRVAAALSGLAAAQPPTDVLVDLGRLGPVHDVHDGAGDVGVLRRVLDLVILVTGSSLRAVVAGRAAAQQLSEQAGPGRRVGLVVVGAGRPYGSSEVAEAVGLPLLGELPHDPATAAVFSDGAPQSRRTARSALLRGARGLAEVLPAAAAALPALVSVAAADPAPAANVLRLGVGHG